MNSVQMERSIRWEQAHWTGLVDQDDGTPALWETLVRRSMVIGKDLFPPRWRADSAFTPGPWMPNDEARRSAAEYYRLPLELILEWEEYGRRWRAFMEINPKVRLASMMGDISETHDSSSWPFSIAWSHAIRNWVASGFAGERPFDDRNRIDTPEWRAELRRAWEEAGRGCVVWNNADVLEWEPSTAARVVRTPGVMSGDPIVEGTRVLAETVLIEFASGETEASIREGHPSLPEGCLQAVLDWESRATELARRDGIDMEQARFAAAPVVEWRPTE